MDRESDRIRALLMEESDEEENVDSELSDNEDNISIRSQDSETEQIPSDSEDEHPLQALRSLSLTLVQTSGEIDDSTNCQIRGSFYIGKDGTKWYKKPPRSQVRTRSENIISQSPRVKPSARSAKSEIECWRLFCTDDMLNTILTHTNTRIRERMAASKYSSNVSYMKETNTSELKAFIGLLFIAGFYRSGRQNLNDHWASDGTGIKKIRLTMSQQRFHFIQSKLCFDDRSTRAERKLFDNLAPIRQIFEMFVETGKQH